MPNNFLLFSFLSLLLLAGGCKSKNENTDKSSKDIYVSYSEEGIGKTFSVPPGIVSVFLDESKVGNTELKILLEDIRHLNFLIIPNLSSDVDNSHYADINNRLENIFFQDLASINNGAELIRVKILPKDSVAISEMIVLVSNEQSLFCVSFQGDINLAKVANLVKPENLEVVTNLNRFN